MIRPIKKSGGTAHVLISRNCVNDCIFCATASKREAGKYLSHEEVIRFIRRCAEKGIDHLVFSGIAEPTLDPHFEEYLSLAHTLKFRTTTLFTNGYGLTRQKAQGWRGQGLNQVLISMHGIKKGHDLNVQRKGSFAEAMRALKIYSAVGYNVNINTCLTKNNIHEIAGLRRLISPYPVKSHTLSFPEWNGAMQGYEKQLLSYEAVAKAADGLIPADSKNLTFENIPYCLVKNRIREMDRLEPIQYLDGNGEKIVVPNKNKEYPKECLEGRCVLCAICPGFERDYIKIRGWGEIKSIVNLFLKSPQSKDASLCAHCPQRPAGHHHADRHNTTQPLNQPQQKRLTVIMKPTSRCNGRCLYCASYKEHTPPDMTQKGMAKINDALLSYVQHKGINHLHFIWHGGEPLLMDRGFYHKALLYPWASHHITTSHGVQTNLLCLDKNWISFLKKHHFNVGSSVDPVGTARDINKKTPHYPLWMEKFILACNNNLDVGIVFTVTAEHLDQVVPIYTFFKNMQQISKKRTGIKINPVYHSGRASRSRAASLLVKPRDYGLFLAALFKIWDKDERPFPISPFNEWLGLSRPACESSSSCHEQYIAVDAKGDVYHCGRFLDQGALLGNLFKGPIHSILNNSTFKIKLSARHDALLKNKCRGCRLWPYCHGGCPYFADIYTGDLTKASPQCETIRVFFKKTHLCHQPIKRRNHK
ncbi:MAG: radical SAM protein [Deltaproteobacteria bacterium]|nr:radical SAM protein [Deltaproteobacteria bacterium]